MIARIASRREVLGIPPTLISFCLVILLAVAYPLAMVQQAHALGLKQVVIGGLVGGAALLALGALAGPAAAGTCTAAAGTSFGGVLAGVAGTALAATAGALLLGKVLAMGTLTTIALIAGGAYLAIAGVLSAPMVVLPALAIAGGLMLYAWNRSSYRYSTSYDRRYDKPFDDPFWDAGARLANRSESGYQDGARSSWDTMRSIFDRDRRDDEFFLYDRYGTSELERRRNFDLLRRVDRFFHGRTLPYGTSEGLRNPDITRGRESLRPGAPSSSLDEIRKAEREREEAYTRVVELMKRRNTGAPSEQEDSLKGAASSAEELRNAIDEYRAADKRVKELTGRLGKAGDEKR